MTEQEPTNLEIIHRLQKEGGNCELKLKDGTSLEGKFWSTPTEEPFRFNDYTPTGDDKHEGKIHYVNLSDIKEIVTLPNKKEG